MNRRASSLAVEVAGKRRDVPIGAVRALQRHAEKRGQPVAEIAVELLARIAADNLVDAVLDDQGRSR